LQRDEVHLVTLTGPGGVGKTRLAQQMAAELSEAFADGIYFISLTPIIDPHAVLTAIARTLGLRDVTADQLNEQLRAHIRDRQMLLVLDNFEQVLTSGPLVAELLTQSPYLKVLATSRTVLHLSGEHDFPVQPLTPPPAVQLFVQRAQAHQPDFALTAANETILAEICARLDGLPLAIELAAARCTMLTPQALLTRLRDRLWLLTGGPRDLPTRQQTLRDTFRWSYDLLPPDGQILFRRLGVFVGGWTVESAEAILGAPSLSVLDGLSTLLDHNLIRLCAGTVGHLRRRVTDTPKTRRAFFGVGRANSCAGRTTRLVSAPGRRA
jgi:predicted ATPase